MFYSNFINCGNVASSKNTNPFVMKNDTNLAQPVIAKKQRGVVRAVRTSQTISMRRHYSASDTLIILCSHNRRRQVCYTKWRFYNRLSCPTELSPENANGPRGKRVISRFTACCMSIRSPLFRKLFCRVSLVLLSSRTVRLVITQLSLVHLCVSAVRGVMLLHPSSNCFHAATLCQQYLQYVEKTWSSVHKFKHEDYKGLVRQVLAYPATYKPLSRVMRE